MSDQALLPAIVVVAFERLEPLKRLLSAIANADYDGYTNIPLIISIDKSRSMKARQIAEEFTWTQGVKVVVRHATRLGLRNHIISCGDLTEKYGAIIVLEDDLFVSPAFYDYAVQAMQFYSDSDEISGISLYACDFNEYARMRFWALDDGYDNCFIQSASSWGQLWTRKQWRDFKHWYMANVQSPVNNDDPVPDSVIEWPESSWKKYFIKYMVLREKYFVYPRVALTTNIGDKGTHTRSEIGNVRVPLALRRKRYNFSSLADSACRYDSHYEIEARCLAQFNKELKQIDFECDLYGTKNLGKIKTEYLLSMRESAKPIIILCDAAGAAGTKCRFRFQGRFLSLGEG